MDLRASRLSLDRQAVPVRYQPLYDYLKGRFADTIVLRFSEIEDLMGGPLPEDARSTESWWALPAEGQPPSDASGAWRHADRTATPNLAAHTVLFDRAPR